MATSEPTGPLKTGHPNVKVKNVSSLGWRGLGPGETGWVPLDGATRVRAEGGIIEGVRKEDRELLQQPVGEVEGPPAQPEP